MSLKKAFKKVTHSIGGLVSDAIGMTKTAAKATTRSIPDLARGDVLSSLSNTGTAISGGTVNLTGKGSGVVNINIKKHLAKMMGASGSGSVVIPAQQKIKTSGLLSQLRQGRGMPGGGSYTETVKNPLGGTSGKTGK